MQSGPDCCHCYWCRGLLPETLEVSIAGIQDIIPGGLCEECESLNGDYVLNLYRWRMPGITNHFAGAGVQGLVNCWWEYRFPPVCPRTEGVHHGFVGFTYLVFHYAHFYRHENVLDQSIKPYGARLFFWGPDPRFQGTTDVDFRPPTINPLPIHHLTSGVGSGWALPFNHRQNQFYDCVRRSPLTLQFDRRRQPNNTNIVDTFCYIDGAVATVSAST